MLLSIIFYHRKYCYRYFFLYNKLLSKNFSLEKVVIDFFRKKIIDTFYKNVVIDIFYLGNVVV